MSSLSVVFSEIGEPQPSTTTTIGFFTRDPIGYEDGMHQYLVFHNNPVRFLDSSGMLAIDPKKANDLADCKGKCGPSSRKPEKGTQGWVECDANGGFVPVAGPLKDISRSDCYSKCGADACTKKHEEHHIEQFKELCPNACKSVCGEDRKGSIIGIADECVNKIECYGNKVGLDCLVDLYKAHKEAERTGRGTRCLNPSALGGPPVAAPCSGYIKSFHSDERARVLKTYKCDRKTIGPIK